MKKSGYAWSVVALLWVVAALNYLDRQVIYSLFPLLQSDLHVSSVQLGFLGTAFLWIYAVVSPLGGYLSDRYSRRSIILISLTVWSLVTLLIGFSKTYPQLLVAEGLMGVSEACYLPAALALISDYHGEKTRSRAVGLHQSGLYTGVALGGFAGGWIGQHYGWHQVFYSLGGFGLLYLLVLVFGLKEAERPVGHTGATSKPFLLSVRELGALPSFWMLILANALSSVAFWCVYSWLALFLYEKFQMSLTVAGFSSTFYIQAASLAGVLVGGWGADSWSRVSRRARLYTQILGFSFAAPALLLIGYTTSWPVLTASLLAFGFGRGFWDANLMPVLCQIVPSDLRATAYGIANLTSCFSGGLMVLLGGILKERYGLGAAIKLSAVALMVSVGILALVKTTREEAVNPSAG
jgi:MFS transporter, Spinster family, sphingosine-1-phosphate transporter